MSLGCAQRQVLPRRRAERDEGRRPGRRQQPYVGWLALLGPPVCFGTARLAAARAESRLACAHGLAEAPLPKLGVEGARVKGSYSRDAQF